MQPAAYWIEHLKLLPHPEGGFYRELYRAKETIAAEALPSRFGGQRSIATSIVYMLRHGERSVFHRIKSDETWHFYAGGALELFQLDEQQPDKRERIVIGSAVHLGEQLQWTVPAGVWFGSRVDASNEWGYSLLGCTVSPGFDFADFEMARRESLLNAFPTQAELVRELTSPEV